MARLFADENFPGPATRRLRDLGHDVITIREAGQADLGISDRIALETASGQDRVFLTLNRRDFIRLHKERVEHTGLIVCTDDKNFSALADRVHDVLKTDQPLQGRLIRVTRPKV